MEKRLPKLERESQKKRVAKVLKKLTPEQAKDFRGFH
jgi:hypothetical protein